MTGTLFTVTFYLAAPFWALMILAPGWSWTRRIVSSPLIVAPCLVVYGILAVPVFGELWSTFTQPTLDGVRALVSSDAGTAIVWAQVIAWDLFLGRWMYLDSRERRISPFAMAPVLVFTILLSPFGLAAYLLLRVPLTRRPVPVSERGRRIGPVRHESP